MMQFFFSYSGGSGGEVHETINEDPEFLTNDGSHLVWVIGDSISRGSSNAKGPNPNGVLKEYNGSELLTVEENDLTSANIGSQWPQFAITYYQLTGKKIIGAFNGSSGSDWNPNGDLNNWHTGSLYDAALPNVQSILNNYGATKLRAVFIILGINDAISNRSIVNIKNAMNAVITKINTDLQTPRIYIVNIGRTPSGYTDRVRDVQHLIDNEDSELVFNDGIQHGLGLAQRYSNIKIVDNLERYEPLGYYGPDNLHLSQDGNNYLGESLATELASE